ncbi:hypothetical protein ACNKFW_21065 (plasmid) [Paracoccus sp. TD-10]|uniref:hypothetical protein n=1 Tax=Paracoccus sp. TD-10 TaxID=3395918 RepID=UPI003AAE0527
MSSTGPGDASTCSTACRRIEVIGIAADQDLPLAVPFQHGLLGFRPAIDPGIDLNTPLTVHRGGRVGIVKLHIGGLANDTIGKAGAENLFIGPARRALAFAASFAVVTVDLTTIDYCYNREWDGYHIAAGAAPGA